MQGSQLKSQVLPSGRTRCDARGPTIGRKATHTRSRPVSPDAVDAVVVGEVMDQGKIWIAGDFHAHVPELECALLW